jgi:hypothetical protein
VTKLNRNGSGLVFSTYLGGLDTDTGIRIALDHSGEVHVAGLAGDGFPTTAGAFQTAFGSAADDNPETRLDGFVAKLNDSGSALVYSTYLGGSGEEQGLGIALDADGNAYVTQFTGLDHDDGYDRDHDYDHGGDHHGDDDGKW